MPRAGRFLDFQQSFSTESKYMHIAVGKDDTPRLAIRVSDHRAAKKIHRRGLAKKLPMCSIVLAPDHHPAGRGWVDAVLWLYERMEQPVPRVTRDAVWQYYASFYPDRYGDAWPRSLVELNRTCRQVTLERILLKNPRLGYIQRLLNAVPDMCQAAKFLLVEEMNRRLRRFNVHVLKKRGCYTLVEQAPPRIKRGGKAKRPGAWRMA